MHTFKPTVVFFDGNDKIGKTTLIKKIPEILVSKSHGGLKDEDIMIFHSSKNKATKENTLPALITSNKLLNYIPQSDDEIYAKGLQIGLSYCISNIISMEAQYEDMKQKKIVLVDRGTISNAVFGLAPGLIQSGIKTYDWIKTFRELYPIFHEAMVGSRIFATDNFRYMNMILLPKTAEMVIDSYNIRRYKEDDEVNIFQKPLDLQLLMYQMFSMFDNVVNKDPRITEIHTLMMDIPKRGKVFHDYTSKYAREVSDIILEECYQSTQFRNTFK